MSSGEKDKIYLLGTRKARLDQVRGRLFLLSICFIFTYVIVAARAADVSLIQSSLIKSNVEGEEFSFSEDKKVIRADIKDRNGVLLARSLKMLSVHADPKLVKDPVNLSKELVKIFPELTYGPLLKKLQGKKRFVWVKRNIGPEEQSKILMLGHPGLGFSEEMKRVYPQGAMTSHVVGSTGVDGQGLSGIESGFDKLLFQQNEALHLTLDVRLQHILRREINSAIDLHKAKGGAGIIMDIDNGEILSIVSLPDYDPHQFQKARAEQVFNRSTLGVYELGSSFKIFSTAALLEINGVSFSKKYDVREPLEVGRFKIRDYHPEERVLTLPEVFIHSSNIGSAMMGEQVGTDNLKKFYKDLGLMDTPDFELSEMGRPLIPEPWREINTLTASYGHGIAVSSLQLVRAAASIVNGGILVNPTLVRQSSYQDRGVSQKSDVRVVSKKTSHRMRQLMRLVVTEGTGSKADVDGYVVGGKTGTAEKPGKGGYNKKRLISSFLGFFPMNKPKYAVFIMVDEPKGVKETYGYSTGGWVAAPAVGKTISSMASVLGIQPETQTKKFEGSLMRYIKTKEQVSKERQIESH